MAISIYALLAVAASLTFAVWANDEANDARYSLRRFAGYCLGSVAFLTLAVALP